MSLGKSLINRRFKGRQRPNDESLVLDHLEQEGGVGLRSITQENDLDQFLRTAEMSGHQFTAEKSHIQVIPITNQMNNLELDFEKRQKESQDSESKIKKFQHLLSIPKRPNWTKEMTARELDELENQSFLDWRRHLAEVEQSQEWLIMTPFERNIQVWKQLWRVIERSDLIVQIVDARHPLFFRCPDLETYVLDHNNRNQELEGVKRDKQNLLLINKADYLNLEQRKAWRDYFNQNGISFVFFSALLSQEESEESKAELEEEESTEEVESDESFDEDVEEDEEKAEEIIEIEDKPQKEEPIDPEVEILTACSLLEYFQNHCKDYPVDNEHPLTIGFVGYPNVGKSSTLNALLGAKKVNTSSTPGKTKHFQTHHLLYNEQKMILCDSPGLVFPNFSATKAEMVVSGVLPIDELREYRTPVDLICERIPKIYLEFLYGVQLTKSFTFNDDESSDENDLKHLLSEFSTSSSELLIKYAMMRGFRKAVQGNADESRASRIILKDYVNGKLLYCHPPPTFSDQRLFNQSIYLPAGQKYEQIQKLLQNRKPTTSALKHDSPPLTLQDTSFFQDKPNEQEVGVKTVGKFKTVPFTTTRNNQFPHQSGYWMESVQEGSDVQSVWSQSILNDPSRGKKSHKAGKKRVKSHTWRVK